MDQKHIILLTGCLVSMSGVLLALYSLSSLSHEMYRANFERNFNQQVVLTKKGELDLKYNSFYMAGATQDRIYLGNSTAPLLVLSTNLSLTDTQHVEIKLAQIDSIMEPRRFRLIIDSPYFFMTHSVMAELLKGHVGQWTASRFIKDSADYFVEAIPISASSFALRSYSDSSESFELAKKTARPPGFRFNHDLLNKQIDGLFCLDGQLLYSESMSRIIYLHFYRNEFVVADTNLDLRYRGHTIDTFAFARIKVAHVESKHQSMLAAPPIQVNRMSCVSEKRLFVRSNILAQNENKEDFLGGSVLDVYDLAQGSYLYSFHIPKYNNISPTQFLVFDNKMAVLYERVLIIYELDAALLYG